MPDRPLSLDEYLAFERRSATKYEFVEGQVYAMAGASFAHKVIVGNVVKRAPQRSRIGRMLHATE